MEIFIQKENIAKEMQITQDIITSRTFRNVLANVVFLTSGNSLCLRATDSNIFLEADLEIEGKNDGTISVYGEKIAAAFRSLPEGTLNIKTIGENLISITPEEKDIEFKLRTMSSEDFPQLPVSQDKQYFALSQAEFIEMVNSIIFSVSTDEARYFLQGVYLESNGRQLTMVATDGRRLSISKKTTAMESEFSGIIVPVKVMNLVRRLCTGEENIEILANEGRIYFRFLHYRISSTLIEGTFPDYKRVIPESQDYKIRINRKDFLESIRRVSILTERTRRVFLEVASETLTLRSEESDFGSVEERIKSTGYNGEKMKFALNYVYLQDPLNVIKSEEVEIEFSNPGKVLTLREADSTENFHIIMPMRV